MHRFYKTSSALHPEQGFCPLDLFSGNEERIRKYLHSLWTSWLSTNGEINNLRIFYDGKVIRPTAVSVLKSHRIQYQRLFSRFALAGFYRNICLVEKRLILQN